jgi:hypothetical protein
MRALQKLYDKGVSIKRPRAVTVREAALCVCVCVCVFAGVDEEEGEEAVREKAGREERFRV